MLTIVNVATSSNVKISVIIPVYNVGSLLEKCLSTCIHQTFQDIEIIVVNDGSTDCSQSIIDKYARLDERIIPITKENEGLLLARMSGLAIARGNYVFHLDGDDYLPEDSLQILYDAAIKNDLDYVMGDFYYLDKNKIIRELRDDLKMGATGRELFDYLFKYVQWDVHGRLIKKSLYEDFIYKPIFMGEDIFQNVQVSPKVKRAGLIHRCVYYYVLHEASVTNCKDKDQRFLLDYEMMDSVLSLINLPLYDSHMKGIIYIVFYKHIRRYIMEGRIKIIDIIKKYLWKNRETRKILFNSNKQFYLLCLCYLCAPSLISYASMKYSNFRHSKQNK